MSSGDPVVLGPLATVGLLSLGWAAGRRSPTALVLGIAALVLETNWTAYKRLKNDPRFWAANLLLVRSDGTTESV